MGLRFIFIHANSKAKNFILINSVNRYWYEYTIAILSLAICWL